MKIEFLFLVMFGFFSSCGRAMENRAVDRFVWDVQLADYDQNQCDDKGSIELDDFLAELKRFPWREQAELAERYGKISPTVSVTDYLTDRGLFISPAIGNEDVVGYFVGYIRPCEKRFLGSVKRYRRVEMVEMTEMEEIRKLVACFFKRDDRAVDRLLSRQTPFMKTNESISWNRYMQKKKRICNSLDL